MKKPKSAKAKGAKHAPKAAQPKVQIQTVVDSKRGCGWRKPGGFYFRTDGFNVTPCGKMPIPLTICPCCGNGIKPKIGFSWINPKPILTNFTCTSEDAKCATCPMGDLVPEKAGLIWIGGAFYKTPGEFTAEAVKLGVSRRIHNVPKGFTIGKDWVFLAHRDAIAKTCETCKGKGKVETQTGEDDNPVKLEKCSCKNGTVYTPAIFHAFIPTRVEYVVTGKESQKKLKQLIDKGVTPVNVKREGELELDDQ